MRSCILSLHPVGRRACPYPLSVLRLFVSHLVILASLSSIIPLMAQPKQTRDRGIWLSAVIGGSISAPIAAWASFKPVANKINHLITAQIGRVSVSELLSVVFAAFCLLILPAVMSGIAKRWTFFWGLYPALSFCVWVNLEEWAEGGWKEVKSDFLISFLFSLGCVLILSGPVSFFRWLHVRGKRRQAALLASYHAMREAASIPQEGVWPPPPDYTA